MKKDKLQINSKNYTPKSKVILESLKTKMKAAAGHPKSHSKSPNKTVSPQSHLTSISHMP